MKKSGEPLPDNIVFTLSTNEKIDFPLTVLIPKVKTFIVNSSMGSNNN